MVILYSNHQANKAELNWTETDVSEGHCNDVSNIVHSCVHNGIWSDLIWTCSFKQVNISRRIFQVFNNTPQTLSYPSAVCHLFSNKETCCQRHGNETLIAYFFMLRTHPYVNMAWNAVVRSIMPAKSTLIMSKERCNCTPATNKSNETGDNYAHKWT